MPLVARGDGLGEIRCELHPAVRRTEEVAREDDALRLQRAQVEVVTAAVTGGDDVSEEPGFGTRQRFDPSLHMARLHQPPDEVSPSEPARRPRRPPAGDDHVAAGLVQLLGDLAARLGAADDEHAAGRERLLVAIVVHVDLEQVRRQRVGGRRPVGALVRARGEDDGAGAQLPGRRAQDESAVEASIESTDTFSRTGAPAA